MSSTERFQRLEKLFHELADLGAAEQAQQLREIQSSEPELYPDLLRMLGETRADQREQLDGLMHLAGRVTENSSSAPETVGPYRILGMLGQGGMGRVYEAEQTEPVRRRVALKIARGGLLSESARLRFKAERQTLALLDHPNIAKIFDAGSTESGRLWFAMELVHGQPITLWAEQQQLGLHECIHLFLPVCQAVHHAHQKGVIHRDLKPSNLLVVDDGGVGQPRVIDFGVAKIMAEMEEAEAFATRVGDAVGTPEYMSPEQAALGEIDIDTRSDVYGLGLVLHELLVGRLPIDPDTLKAASFGEICRRIREDPVTAPSRLAIQARNAMRAGRLKGDLDLVMLKALAKDRAERYDSAAALAEDLQRYLDDLPVQAAPPRLSYRVRKFVRRNRIGVAAAAAVASALVVSTVIAGLGLLEARESERKALQAATEAEQARRVAESSSEFLVELFTSADPRAQPGDALTARDLLERGIERVDALADQPGVQAQLLQTLGDVSWSLGDFQTAEGLLQRALDLRVSGTAGDALSEAVILNRLSGLDRDRDELEEARRKLERALMLLESVDMAQSRQASNALNNLGIVLRRLNRLDEAASTYERALAILEVQLEQEPEQAEAWRSNIPNLRLNLSGVHFARGDYAQARDVAMAALPLMEELYSPEHTYLATANNNIGRFHAMLGDLNPALRHAQRAVAINRTALGSDHPTLADNLLGLGQILMRLGRFDESEQALTEALAIYQDRLGADNYRATRPMGNLGLLYLASDRPELALERLAETARVIAIADHPSAKADQVVVMRRMALALSRLKRDAEARQLAESILELSGALDVEQQAVGHLLMAWLLVEQGDSIAAALEMEQALQSVDCEHKSCMLDRADEVLTRAHWLARSGQIDAAFDALQKSVQHPYWASWMLDSADFQFLRADPRWSLIQADLSARLAADSQ